MHPQEIPIGLGMIASVTRNEGHKIAFLDLNAHRIPLQVAAQEIMIDDYDIIGIGGLSSQYQDIRNILPICRQIHPDAIIVAGGGFVTYMPDKMLRLRPEIDIIVIGEGEDAWKDLLKAAPKKDLASSLSSSIFDGCGGKLGGTKEELDDYLQNYNYKVTINTKRPPQLVLKKEEYYVS